MADNFTVPTIDEHPIKYSGRVVIKLIFNDGKIQPFYKSTGTASGMPGTWFPFDGAEPSYLWFRKDRYKVKNDKNENLPLHRYGSGRLKELSDWLAVLDTTKACKVDTLTEVNLYLFDSESIDYSKLANLL